MRLGILSDTHNQLERTRRAVGMLTREGAEVLIHCGDFTRPDILEACSALPCYFVFGNNDADNADELRRVGGLVGAVCLEWGGAIELGGKRIGVTHGDMRIDVNRVLDKRPDYLLSGHSHVANDFHDGAVRRINPGALHRAEHHSVAMLDLKRNSVEFLLVEP